MDPWKIFSELCRLVVEEQNVFLEISLSENSIDFHLWPLEERDEEEE